MQPVFISASNKSNKKNRPAIANRPPVSATKKQFEELVKHIKGTIARGAYKKIVAARALVKQTPKQLHPVTLFHTLCKTYPSAFVSMVYTSQYGLWIGATPEILLEVKSNTYKTFALAGTMPAKSSARKWGSKELEEHKLVADYIQQSFRKLGAPKPHMELQESTKAGDLLHLRTTYVYTGLPKTKWNEVVKVLHPTPAVAGLPKKKSIQFIKKQEQNDRGFYSGYLGPVNLGDEIHLFVNLRCMQLFDNHYALYSGCGITASSVPSKEWKESELKMMTLEKIIRQIK
ncbi:MAG: chorismate-binding protein [Bacteroidetes bacterium]|nr:chorismate-binding protein [Bacteroidota bacterium]